MTEKPEKLKKIQQAFTKYEEERNDDLDSLVYSLQKIQHKIIITQRKRNEEIKKLLNLLEDLFVDENKSE